MQVPDQTTLRPTDSSKDSYILESFVESQTNLNVDLFDSTRDSMSFQNETTFLLFGNVIQDAFNVFIYVD